MPLFDNGQARKSWRYVGVYDERLMLCAGAVRIGPFPQVFWAVWDRENAALRERTRLLPRGSRYVSVRPDRVVVRDGPVALDLRVVRGAPIETVSAAGSSWIWTRKQGDVRVVGRVSLAGEPIDVDARGCVDESAGYHARDTDWEWSAGVGALADGRSVGWNVVSGVHDSALGSERTLWVDGEPSELPPVSFSSDLSGVSFDDDSGSGLSFSAEATRARRDNLVVVRSDYVQPFGSFRGEFPGGLALAEGRGVMERHSAHW
jgi:hypothetical protein